MTQFRRPVKIRVTRAALVPVVKTTDIIRILVAIPILRLFARLLLDLKDGANVRGLPEFRRLLEQPIVVIHFLYLRLIHISVSGLLRNRVLLILHFHDVEALVIRPLFMFTLRLLVVSFCHESLVGACKRLGAVNGSSGIFYSSY